MKKFITITLWCVGLCGILGLHRFYLGYKITGFIWLFTLGGFFLGTLYDIANIDKLIAESDGNLYEPKPQVDKNLKQEQSDFSILKKQNKIIEYNEYTEVYYRISGIGRTITEIVNTTSEAEARSVIKAKYPDTKITIVGTKLINNQNKILNSPKYMEVRYRIYGIGRDLIETVSTTSEAEARSIMKAKYPNTNIIITGTKLVNSNLLNYTEVYYRIGGIGRTLKEIIYTTSEAEARSVMKAKYPNTQITIVSTKFIRDEKNA